MLKLRLSFVLLLCCSSIVWSATTTPATVKKAAASPARVSDAELEKAIKAKFAKSKINADKFTAKVQGGVATIEGHTGVIQHKGTATRLAKTAGALAVVNNIEISEAAKAKAQANLETGRRRAQIKRSDTPVAR